MGQARGSKLHHALGSTATYIGLQAGDPTPVRVESVELLSSRTARVVIVTRTGARIEVEGPAEVLL